MLTCAIVGYGNRGSIYADLLGEMENVRIACVCDSNEKNLRAAQKKFALSDADCFSSDMEFFKAKRADCAVIATMDKLHAAHAVEALGLGYDILLEKPIATTPEDCDKIEAAAIRSGRKVLVCHVLRYTSFFRKIKELLSTGKLGEITSVSESENVAFVHYWLSFLHGNWNNSEESSPIILQKCCHDFDILSWLLDRRCERVSSFGNLFVYKKKNAPEGAAAYCCDCRLADECLYSGLRIMKKDPYWLKGYYEDMELSDEGVENVLSDRTNVFSRCAFSGRNNVMTDQIVNMWYEGGIPVQHLMSGFSADGRREITIHAARGEIYGYMGAEEVKVHYRPFQEPETVFDLTEKSAESGHGGGDRGIIRSFVSYLETGEKSDYLSVLSDSLMSHRIAFAAEESRRCGGKLIVL